MRNRPAHGWARRAKVFRTGSADRLRKSRLVQGYSAAPLKDWSGESMSVTKHLTMGLEALEYGPSFLTLRAHQPIGNTGRALIRKADGIRGSRPVPIPRE